MRKPTRNEVVEGVKLLLSLGLVGVTLYGLSVIDPLLSR